MDIGKLADICVPLPFVMLLGAATVGLFIGLLIMAHRVDKLQRTVVHFIGSADLHQ
jgi:hypothetical protein